MQSIPSYALEHCSTWRGLNYETMALEIAESFKRSAAYGISRTERDKKQRRLTVKELQDRCDEQQHMLEVVGRFIGTFYLLLQPEDFMFAFVDSEGYILQMYGSEALLAVFDERNCSPGFRWTEKDVGTSAISLCLARRMPIQINDKDHYCKRAHQFTSSGAPIFDKDCNVRGVLVTSGSSKLVHAHTLAMVINAARAIERELYLAEVNLDLRREAAFLENTIEGISSGILITDTALNLVYMNKRAKAVLGCFCKKGPNLPQMGLVEDIRQAALQPGDWQGRELTFTSRMQSIRLMANVKAIFSEHHKPEGFIVDFEPTEEALQSAHHLTGSSAYFTFRSLVGRSPAFTKALSLAKRAAEVDSTVLIHGETGTGKELFAQAIHNAAARKKKGLFVPINCAAIPAELLESELFGYVDGAYTGAQKGGKPGKFELANNGTILLDEIGDMPLGMQAKLLRVLQTKEVYRIGADKPLRCNVKVIASTHVDLSEWVRKKLFREDLFYRLNVFPIEVPSLRERGEKDILLLAKFFVDKYGPGKLLTAEAERALVRYKWPGNVREMENTLQRAIYLSQKPQIDEGLLSFATQPSSRAMNCTGTLAAMERQVIEDRLIQCGGNMRLTAKHLGISRATLYRKKEAYGLSD